MRRRFLAIVVLGLLDVCRTYAPAANPPMMTHASMDVGNIISIVIPESPDENINIDQLTVEFRQQLERIKKQSRASKVEHGLVTLKRVLPEMSREEKRKTLPLIRRVLHGRRVSNPGATRNWTRDPQVEQTRETGQFVRSRSSNNPEERRIHRDYEEPVVRDSPTTRADQTVYEKEEYRRVNADRTYSNRREDFARRDEPLLREERMPSAEEETQPKIPRSGSTQDWSSNWDDQYRGDGRNYPETSTIDCNYKLDRTVRQKEPANEIIQNDRYEKASRLVEMMPEENPECTKFNQRSSGRYPPVSRLELNENSKRNVKDVRGYDSMDSPTYINYPKDFDINTAINPNCDHVKKNNTVPSLRDLERSRADLSPEKLPRRHEQMNIDSEEYRSAQKSVQEPREQPDRSNASGFENVVNESSDDYAGKKKRGPSFSEEIRGLSAMNPSTDRRNVPIYEDRSATNSSDDAKDSSNVYEMFGDKSVHSGLTYIQTEQGGFRRNLDSAPKTQGPQMIHNYGAESLALRIQRAISDSPYKLDITKLPIKSSDKNIEDLEGIAERSLFARLKRLFKAPETPGALYNKVVVVYGDEAEKEEKIRETFTEDGRLESTLLPSVAEPSSSTSQEVPRSTTDLIIKPRVFLKI